MAHTPDYSKTILTLSNNLRYACITHPKRVEFFFREPPSSLENVLLNRDPPLLHVQAGDNNLVFITLKQYTSTKRTIKLQGHYEDNDEATENFHVWTDDNFSKAGYNVSDGATFNTCISSPKQIIAFFEIAQNWNGEIVLQSRDRGRQVTIGGHTIKFKL